MEPICKYEAVKTTKNTYDSSISIQPETGVYFNIYPDGAVREVNADDIARALNFAYTQAIIDLLNGDVKIPIENTESKEA